ncbi:TPA: hypothetical protein ACK1AI_000706, partial [Staphylococcus aureus]
MNNDKQNDTEELYMYKNYNMSQLTLPIETEITFPENDVSTIINHLVESIPDAEFNDYYNHRGP